MFLFPENVKKIDGDFLAELHNFLVAHPNVILRELKKEFSAVDNFSDKLDTLIDFGLIIRQDRRYLTGITVWPDINVEAELSEISEKIVKVIQAEQIDLADSFFSLQGPARKSALDIPDDIYQQLQPFIVEKITLKSKYSIVSYQNQLAQTTLANYFTDATQTPQLMAMYELVGDVTPRYFLDQALPKLFRAQNKPLHESRYDIFTDALKELNFLSADGQNVANLINEFSHPQKSPIVATLFNTSLIQLSTQFEPAVCTFLAEILRGLILARLGDMEYFQGRVTDGPAWNVQYIYKSAT